MIKAANEREKKVLSTVRHAFTSFFKLNKPEVEKEAKKFFEAATN